MLPEEATGRELHPTLPHRRVPRKSPRCARPMRLNCLGWHRSSIWAVTSMVRRARPTAPV
ncbi:hypothetical protein JG688_00013551 [Phytophthora aleatoria]|uniref:Uncharacterized protein n=1 Tax=Phytophthora aleatoria TaxID=2496075 RepID=A0A8J5I8Y4_9STRA|nr:hypothetical protein JG688_00013551 [Phytophthora aleatoria]